jgi:hypothetical protein
VYNDEEYKHVPTYPVPAPHDSTPLCPTDELKGDGDKGCEQKTPEHVAEQRQG